MSNYKVLKQLGLSKTAVACYESLFNNGGTDIVHLAERLCLPKTGLYRILKQLELKGFVASLKTEAQPTYFFAERLDKALRDYARYQRQLVSDLIDEQIVVLAKRSGKARN